MQPTEKASQVFSKECPATVANVEVVEAHPEISVLSFADELATDVATLTSHFYAIDDDHVEVLSLSFEKN